MKISKDFEEFFALLNDHEVHYLVIGGYAYAIHAEPRYTKDLDIFFDKTPTNAKKLIAVLTDFGFQSLSITIDDLTTHSKIIHIGNPPLRIDLLNDIDRVSFDEAWNNRITTDYGDQTIFVIAKKELIKRALCKTLSCHAELVSASIAIGHNMLLTSFFATDPEINSG